MCGDICERDACGHRGDAEDGLLVFDFVEHDGAACDFYIFPDTSLIVDDDRAADHGSIADGRGTAEGGSPTEEDIIADDAVVPDMDLVIYFGAVADLGDAELRTIDRGARADLDIVSDLDGPDLRDLDCAACLIAQQVSEAVRSDDRVRKYDAVVTHHAPIADDHTRVNEAL